MTILELAQALDYSNIKKEIADEIIKRMKNEIDLKDKLSRRNAQIKELKKEVVKLKEGNCVVEAIIEGHPTTVFECVHNTFIEHYPKTAAEHQAISHYCNKIQELLI